MWGWRDITRVLAAALAWGGAVAAGPAAAVEPITLLFNYRPPYFMQAPGGALTGITAERTSLVFERAGIPFEWRQLPATRMLLEIRQDAERLCTPGWFKRPERELFGLFTQPIYRDKPTAILTRRDNDRVWAHRTLVELMSDDALLMLGKMSYSYGPAIDRGIAAYRPEIRRVTAMNIPMAHMIRAGRADYMFVGEEEGRYLIQEAGLDDLALHHTIDMPAGNARYIICTKTVGLGVIERLNRAIDAALLPVN